MQQPRFSSTIGIDELARAVAALEVRVAAVESRIADGAAPAAAIVNTAAEPDLDLDRAEPPTAAIPRMPSLGRAVLLLAGAFLLRALTDARVVEPGVGVALGMAYALLAVLLTDREARAGRRGSACLLGLATALVAYPFLWETATKLGLLPPAAAASFLAAVSALGLGVASRHRLPGLAWAFTGGALVVATGLAWVTNLGAVFAGLIVAVGIAALWLGYGRGWWGLSWPSAALANGVVLLLSSLAIRSGSPLAGRPHPSAEAMLLLSLALPAAYLASFFVRALAGRREVGAFEILQTLGSLLAGVTGAVLVVKSGTGSTASIGWPLLPVAAASYAVAFVHVRRREGRSVNFFYFAWLGLALVVLGTILTIPASARPFVWGVLGVALALAGGRFDRWTLRLHGAVYLVAAAVVTGIAAAAFSAFVARDPAGWHPLGLSGTAVWLLTGLGYVVLVLFQPQHRRAGWQRLPRAIVAALLVIGAGSVLVPAIVAGLGARIPGSEAAIVAAVRTIVLAAAAVAVAAGSRSERLAEFGWFTNPLLVLAGLKILTEDLRRGTPASLCLGLGCFGMALIAAPRLRRKDRT